ncbi:MAG: PqqD family protein [Ardenticatenaceae bacterium]|nr:PqqD family protein [Ardenticatenaceae bacterium]
MTNQSPKIELLSELIWREMDGNAVVVSPRDGKVRVLNEVGTFIWQLLAEQVPRAEIVVHLVETYEVSVLQAEQDLDKFINDLLVRGILKYN